MTIYRIKDWDKHFENNRSREMKRLEWVPVPNKMDGAGYAELVEHPNGAAHLGAWLAIVEIASRNEIRGTMVRDKKPQTPQSLARISRLPAELFDEVILRLLRIGWIEAEFEESSNEINGLHDGAGIPHEGAPRVARAELNRTEKNRTEKKQNISASADAAEFSLQPPLDKKPTAADGILQWFERDFWPLYPRKVDKADALKAAIKTLPGSGVAPSKILGGLKAQLPKFQALIDAGEPDRVPHASTWIRKRRWEDDIEEYSRNGNFGQLAKERWPGQLTGSPNPGLVGSD